MNIETIVQKFSPLINDYVAQNSILEEFYGYSPTWEGLEKSLRVRQFSIEKRKILKNVLFDQYKNMPLSDKTTEHINLLEHTTTYTVTTGHQLSLFTGPLYFVYKICSAIKLCEQLKAKFPIYNFVPVYWMASEDHDFEEINHFQLFNKTHRWDTPQKGAVGKFTLEGIAPILAEITDLPSLFQEAYKQQKNLSEATLHLVNALFGDYGLIALEPDNPTLKKLFSTVIKNELTERKSSHFISETSKKLESNGYKQQVTPREINLFFHDDQLRERIIWEDNCFKINQTSLSFTHDEMLDLVEKSPEKFSPNVALRPVYQEVILPNLAYIGGPGELAYWLQLKSNFDRLDVYFPVLLPRDSFIIVNKSSQKTLEKLDITIADVRKPYDSIKKELVQKWTDVALQFDNEKEQMNQIMTSIQQKCTDKSLHPAIEAAFQKMLKSVDDLEKRIQKSEELRHETTLQQLKKLQEKLFPNGIPQERVENVLNYLLNDEKFIEKIYTSTDTMDMRQKVLYL